MAKKSLAVISHGDEDKLELNTTWTFVEVEEYLRQQFPNLFLYLDTLWPISPQSQGGGDDDNRAQPGWILCCKVRKSLKPVPETFPTGKTLKFNKGTGRAGVQDSYVYIGMFRLFVSRANVLLTSNSCVF